MNTFSWIHYNYEYSLKQWAKIFLKASEGLTGLIITATLEDLKTFETIIPPNLEIHIWFWVMICNDPEIHSKHPDWFNINRNGISSLKKPPYVGYYKWLCPNNPDVLPYLEKRLKDYLDLDFITGISLDYCRYPDVILPEAIQPKYNLIQKSEMAEFDFCYCDYCRTAFQSKSSLNPFDLQTRKEQALWARFREDSITNIANHLSSMVKKYGLISSASPFPSPAIAKKLVRQNWADWKLDRVFPMNYYTCYNGDLDWLENVIIEGKAECDKSIEYYAALYLPDMDSNALKASIDVSIQAGADGIALFDYFAIKPEYWEILKDYR